MEMTAAGRRVDTCRGRTAVVEIGDGEYGFCAAHALTVFDRDTVEGWVREHYREFK